MEKVSCLLGWCRGQVALQILPPHYEGKLQVRKLLVVINGARCRLL